MKGKLAGKNTRTGIRTFGKEQRIMENYKKTENIKAIAETDDKRTNSERHKRTMLREIR